MPPEMQIEVQPLKSDIMDELDAKTIEACRQRLRQQGKIQQETLREL